MLLTEYDEAETMRLIRKDGKREGREEGRKEGREEGLAALVDALRAVFPDFSSVYDRIKATSQYADVTREEVLKLYSSTNK